MALENIWTGFVASTDKSYEILQELFGVTPSTMLTTDHTTSLFSVVFQYFNAGMLAIAVLIYVFLFIVGVINTAKDGQFLGKEWSAHWISLRAVFGSVAAVPFASGYCVAQYAVYSLVIAGISFANYVWYNVVSDVVDGNVPPIVSTEVSKSIENYLSVFMMTNLTRNVLYDNMFYTSPMPGFQAPCVRSDSYVRDVPLANSGTEGSIPSVELISATCNISFTTAVNSQFVKDYASPLTHVVTVGEDPDNEDNMPFKDYNSIFGYGLPSWSQIDSSAGTYEQYKLNTVDWEGKFTIEQFKDQPTTSDIDTIAGIYSLNNPVTPPEMDYPYGDITPPSDPNTKHDPGYLKINLVNNNAVRGTDQLATYSPVAIKLTAQDIIYWLQNQDGSVHESCDTGDFDSGGGTGDPTNICEKAKLWGWWTADELYLDFDNALASNLQNLYANFEKLSSAANKISNISTIPVEYDKFRVNYTYNSNSIEDLLEDGSDLTYQSLCTADQISSGTCDFSYSADTDLSDYEGITNSGTFTTSLEQVRNLFDAIIDTSSLPETGSGSVYSNKTDLHRLVKDLLVDGMQFQYAQYVYIIYSLANSAYTPYVTESYQGGDSAKTDQSDKLVSQVIVPVLTLFHFFYTNEINFGPVKDQVDTEPVTDPAEALLTDLFAKMGTNTSAAEPGSMLYAIYNIGTVPESEDGSFAAQNFSMVQNVQAVGMSLIEGTINSMIGVYMHAKDRLVEIEKDAKSQAKDARNQAIGWSVGATLMPFASNSFNAVAAMNYAEVMFNISLEIAKFSLSMVWLPLVFFVLSSIFTIGVSFSLIIPLTPFILFWAGKTAWLLLVIEAMVAAPFVALGLVYPEGHQVFGKSQPAIDIMMNLVLRPVFMIIGLICGMGLTYVVIRYSAEGFHAIADSLLNLMPIDNGSKASEYARGTFACLIIFLYASFLAMAFAKCFSLIYVIPDKVLSWLGNTRAERAGEAEMQEFKQAGTQAAQGGMQAAQSTGQQALDAGKQHAQTVAQGSMDVAKAQSGVAQGASQDVKETGDKVGQAAVMMAGGG